MTRVAGWFGLACAMVIIGMALREVRKEGDLAGTARKEPYLAEKAKVQRFWDAYRRATDLRLQGALGESNQAYREALQLNPEHEDARYWLGNVLFETEKYGEAAREWQKLVMTNPQSTRAHAQLGVLYSCGAPGAPFDLDAAESHLLRAVEINKEQIGAYLKLAEVMVLKGDRPAARGHLRLVLGSNPGSPEAHYLMGYLAWLDGQPESAAEAFRMAIRCAQSHEPGDGTVREGDTRREGARPLLTEGAGRKSIFSPFWEVLGGRDADEATAAQAGREYRTLHARLEALTRGLHRVRAGGIGGPTPPVHRECLRSMGG